MELTTEQKNNLDILSLGVVSMERETVERLLVEQFKTSIELHNALTEAMDFMKKQSVLIQVLAGELERRI